MKKILIIKMSALGDVFMALPHVETILAHHPDDEAWIMTSPAHHDVFAGHPRLKTVLLDRSKTLAPESRLMRTLWVRQQRFDAVYDLQGNRTSRLLVWFSKASKRVGTQPRSIYTCHPLRPYDRETQQSVFDRLNETLVSGGLAPAEPRCAVYPSENDCNQVDAWKEKYGLKNGGYCLLHAGCSPEWSSKKWPYFQELALSIEKLGLCCVWIGAKEDAEMNRQLAARTGVDATNAFTPMQLAVLATGASFAVTNDSGPMHIVAAAGIPVFSFFGPTSAVRSHAIGQEHRAFVRNLSCSPCFLRQCPPERKHACLAGIAPDEVFKTLCSSLQLQDAI